MSPRPQRSEDALTWRRLYNTARWRTTRARQLADHPLCEMCLEDGRLTPATICNHVDKDAKQTEHGFFAGPFNSLCKTHHDSTQQSFERTGSMKGCDESGWPVDPRHSWNKG